MTTASKEITQEPLAVEPCWEPASSLSNLLFRVQHLPTTHSLTPPSMSSTIPSSYKAIVYEHYGRIEDILELRELQTTPLPPTHVRIQVRSASLNPIDVKVAEVIGEHFTGGSPSEEKPYRAGFDAAGVIVEVGGDVKFDLHVGDEVYMTTADLTVGTLGEYITVDPELVVRKPKNIDFDHAAALPVVSLTSYIALTKHAKLQAGERILILGGSSGTGIFAIQYAKAIGAFVIATTSSKNAKFVKSLGADEVVEYTREKWGDVLDEHSVDVVFDCVAEANAWVDGAQKVLKKNSGRFVTLRMDHPRDQPAKFGALFDVAFCFPTRDHFEFLTELVESGKIQPVIDSTYPFEKTIEAFTHLKGGRAVGKIIVQIA